MTSIRLTAFALLLGRSRRDPPRRRAPQPDWFGAPADEHDADAPGHGTGWFESSAELKRGLAVREADGDELPSEWWTTAWSTGTADGDQGRAPTARATAAPSSITASA
jgi:hypothetical protein